MTGDAWMVGKNKYGKYLFYQGKFKNDEKIDDRSHWAQLESIQEISKITDKYNFQCDLKWYELK